MLLWHNTDPNLNIYEAWSSSRGETRRKFQGSKRASLALKRDNGHRSRFRLSLILV